MKFLVDECLRTDVAQLLTDAGHDAVHVGDAGLLGRPDDEVMATAAEQGRVVVSADTDFGEPLALGGQTLPGVILLRRRHDPGGPARAIIAALPDIEDSLEAGAVVAITEDRVRIRALPIE